MLMVPAAIAYAIVVSPHPQFFICFYVVTLIAIPMLPIILATIIGPLIAMAASVSSVKTALTSYFTIIFFVWRLWSYGLILDQFRQYPDQFRKPWRDN